MARSEAGERSAGVMPLVKILLVAAGLLLLAYLVATDRHGWFQLRPASGTAAALGQATDRAPPAR